MLPNVSLIEFNKKPRSKEIKSSLPMPLLERRLSRRLRKPKEQQEEERLSNSNNTTRRVQVTNKPTKN